MRGLRTTAGIVTAMLVAVGCKQNSPAAATSELEKSFQLNVPTAAVVTQETMASDGNRSADQLQQVVGKAVSAMKTNAYVEAAVLLQSLKTQPVLTPDQRIAVQNASVAVMARVAEAAERGDPEAIKAVEAIKGMPRR